MKEQKIRTRAKDKMLTDFSKIKFNPNVSRFNTELDKHIRCNCRKYYGMRNINRVCPSCKSKVIARGHKVISKRKA